MQAKRSYSGVLAAAAATAFSLQANVAAAESPAVNDSEQAFDDAAITSWVKAALSADNQLLTRGIAVSKVENEIELKTAPEPGSD